MDRLKEIVATFVGKLPDEINDQTLIDRSAIPGSILIHRMYAAINAAGYSIDEYSNIKHYGELIVRLRDPQQVIVSSPNGDVPKNGAPDVIDGLPETELAVGIDIESVGSFPEVSDYREDEFYASNFTQREISYALLRQDPRETLAGIFCAKEALCKADRACSTTPFCTLEIEHDEVGVPYFNGFAISISHANGFAIAVAATRPSLIEQKSVGSSEGVRPEISSDTTGYGGSVARAKYQVLSTIILSILSLVISVVAFLMVFLLWR